MSEMEPPISMAWGHNSKRWPLYDFRKRWPSQYINVANVIRLLRKVAKSAKRWPMYSFFAKGGQASKKVAIGVRFLRKVAKSVKRWPMLYDFCERWPSQ